MWSYALYGLRLINGIYSTHIIIVLCTVQITICCVMCAVTCFIVSCSVFVLFGNRSGNRKILKVLIILQFCVALVA